MPPWPHRWFIISPYFDSLDQINQPSDTINFTIPVFVTDADGDSTQGNIAVAVIDGELPVATLAPDLSADGIILSETPQDPLTANVPATDSTVLTITAGADRVTSEDFNVIFGSQITDTNGNPVSQGGAVLELRKIDNVTIIAINPTTGLRVLTIHVNSLDIDFNNIPAGQNQQLEVTLTVNGPIDHLATDGSKLDQIDFDLPLKVIDSDGDQININFPFSVIDGKDPVIVSANPLLVNEAGVNDAEDSSDKGQTTIRMAAGSDSIASYSVDVAAFNALALASKGDLITLG